MSYPTDERRHVERLYTFRCCAKCEILEVHKSCARPVVNDASKQEHQQDHNRAPPHLADYARIDDVYRVDNRMDYQYHSGSTIQNHSHRG